MFFGSLLESNDIAEAAQGVGVYRQAIPYMFYAWLSVVRVLLVAAGLFPAIGPMRKAEMLARHGSAGAMLVGELNPEHNFSMKSIEQEFELADKDGGKLHNFLVPLLR